MLIRGTYCSERKGVGFTLQSVFGINKRTANQICAMVGVRKEIRLNRLNAGRLDKLNKICRDHVSTGLERRTKEDIKHLIHIKHYKGVRHMFGLPARGQRTRTNASTSKKLSVVKRLNPKKGPAKGGMKLKKGGK